ncbi:MAG: LysR substrate-binding domain-containing protein, partial [Pseudomonadota bacterium]
KNRLPLSNLQAFDAAARHESFAAAAEELNLSQAAVSRQIKTLESHLDAALFRRSHRAVHLTAKGSELHQTVQLSLRLLRESFRSVRRRSDHDTIHLASDLSLTHFWLLPRLSRLQDIAGKTRISIMASDQEEECLADTIDIAVAYGNGHWPGFDSRLLIEEEVFPVCSPAYLERLGPLSKPEDLLRGTFLHVVDGPSHWVDWPELFAGLGVRFDGGGGALEFNSMPLSIQAACAGQGIALGWKYLLDDLLDSGSLVRPVPNVYRTERGYHVLSRTGANLQKPARDIVEWLVGR